VKEISWSMAGGDWIPDWGHMIIAMDFTLDCEREEDGRWLAEVSQLPGVMAYGGTPEEAMARAEVLALRVLAEQIERGEPKPQPIRFIIPAA